MREGLASHDLQSDHWSLAHIRVNSTRPTVTTSPAPMTEAMDPKPGGALSYEKPAERGGLNVNMAEREYDLGITTLINKAQPP